MSVRFTTGCRVHAAAGLSDGGDLIEEPHLGDPIVRGRHPLVAPVVLGTKRSGLFVQVSSRRPAKSALWAWLSAVTSPS